ncbi:hypothetical protein BJ166DRAFT_517543 [Pestalotiopsis sp. NC0098]|nr:hypothetical protein BJ166DRAFT_517543 [Pestalotiopsis sp. NC0098]
MCNPMSVRNNNIGTPARRKRPAISCRECHRRKQKCDRRHPCAHCTKRGKTVSLSVLSQRVFHSLRRTGCLSI